MEILYELSRLLFEDAETLNGKSQEYRDLKRLEGQLMEKIPVELRGKLTDVQSEIEYKTLLDCFLYGIQVGVAASNLR